ncbi:hypothetical protein RF11_07453 [Thelohanellus kitauei]|uniref:Uncharacterized protein n=1 Tax=Thelohanellus kitauei TaxID=669202 RepID=A0A0C2MJT9_THEKT|nr:hypothetical protein RF11_07453 [Thelohanellus kitauei]
MNKQKNRDKIHSSFLTSNLLFNVIENTTLNESFPRLCTAHLEICLHRLILAITDMEYIKKLQHNQKLFLYENLKRIYLGIINQDFINNVFSTCEYQFLKEMKYKYLDFVGISEFETYKYVMEMTLVSFNESNYLEIRKANYLMSICSDYCNDLSEVPSDNNHAAIISDTTSLTNISHDTKLYMKNTLKGLLRWFIHIFELKFIFGDINSIIRNLDFKRSR